jgi:hypothetical protein
MSSIVNENKILNTNHHCFELISTDETISPTSAAAAAASTMTSTPSSSFYPGLSQSLRDPTIRHSGRAHIRGKIRRIWRPRYLELCDKGLVRYYELPPTADVTMPEESDWQHINMVIKDTLIIYHARIIDVTTLRDLHVGLPRGSFGFLFRGQRLFVNDLLSKKNQDPDAPREYFCAVSTLEEAQTWVIALQWAAAMCKKNRIAETYYHDDSDYRSSGENLSAMMGEERRNDSHRGVNVMQCRPYSSSTGSIRDNYDRSIDSQYSSVATSSSSASSKRAKSGRILVTKVNGFRVIRVGTSVASSSGTTSPTSQSYQWDVAYEIALLLVQHTKVEERRILRTASELEDLLKDLASGNKNPLLQPFWNQLLEQIKELPRFHGGRGGKSQGNSNFICNPHEVDHSLSKLDGILRSLAMEASAVNSRAMKRAFGLDVERPTVENFNWWTSPMSSCAGSNYKKGKCTRVVFWQSRQVPSNITVDEYVREWLLQSCRDVDQYTSPSSWQMKMQFLVLRRPWFLVGGVGVAVALLYPVSQSYQRCMVSMTVRADVLAASWCLAYWFGRKKSQEAIEQEKSKSFQSSYRGIRQSLQTESSYVNNGRAPFSQAAVSPARNFVVPSFPTSSVVPSEQDIPADASSDDSAVDGEDLDYIADQDESAESANIGKLSSPIPQYPGKDGSSCWSEPPDPSIFRVRGSTYLEDRIKVPSGPSPFKCRGVDVWMTDNPERHIARHPSVLGGKIKEEDTFLVNFLLPFGNFVSYFSVPKLEDFPNKEVADVWSKFANGDQQYRDARLKLLPVVIEGPWIVKAAVGNGTAPALLGKVIPLQYFFQQPEGDRKGTYEVDVIITASSIAKGILSVVKGHTKSLTIAFAIIIEASTQQELPETVLCSFQIHALNLDDCPHLPACNLDDI